MDQEEQEMSSGDDNKEWDNLAARIAESKEAKRIADAQEFEKVAKKTDGNDKEQRSVAEKLVDLISQNSNKDQYDVAYAEIQNANHHEIVRVENNKFKRHLTRLYHESENKVANAEAVTNAVQVLQAKAEYNGDTFPLHVRVAWYNGDIYHDLTNQSWECIKITGQGWQLLDKTPNPLFTRYKQVAQVNPIETMNQTYLTDF